VLVARQRREDRVGTANRLGDRIGELHAPLCRGGSRLGDRVDATHSVPRFHKVT
jgi:hypothetical protein